MSSDRTWKSEFLVSATSPRSPNSVRSTSLDNGGFVVVFEDGESPDFAADRDILAVIYDQFGEVATPVFRASDAVPNRIETGPEVARIPGGFVLVYTGLPSGSTGGTLVFETYSNAGDRLTSGVIPVSNRPDFTDGGSVRVRDYDVTGFADGSFAVVYEREIREGGIIENAFDDIIGVVVSAGGGVGPDQEIFRDPDDDDFGFGEAQRPSTALLANGSLVTAFTRDLGNEDVFFVISSVSGSTLTSPAPVRVTTSGRDESRPSITALHDGGFVVSWVTSSQGAGTDTIEFQVFSDTGAPVSGIVTVATGSFPFSGSVSYGAVVQPLADGGFAILVDDDTTNRVFWRAYDETGASQGPEVEVIDGFRITDNIDLVALDDGRLVAVYKETNGNDGDIYAVIQDPRGTPLEGPFLTDGSDIFTMPQDADPNTPGGQGARVNALAGNDLIIGGRSDDVIEGGGGLDTLLGAGGDDDLDGGQPGQPQSNFDADFILGGAGNDTIKGGGDDDMLFGEGSFIDGFTWVRNPDNDHYYAVVQSTGITWEEANAAANTLETGVHLATITSEAENLFVTSIAPTTGALIGGIQSRNGPEPSGGFGWVSGEAFGFTNWLSGRPDNANGNFLDNTENAVELVGATNLSGAAWDDIASDAPRNAYILEISGAADTIDGGPGADFIDGGLGDDVLFGGLDTGPFPSSNTLIGGEGDDRLRGGNGPDTLTGGPGNDIFEIPFDGSVDTITDFTRGEDLFDLSLTGFRSLNNLIFTSTGFTVPGPGNDTQVVLSIDPATLDSSDFIFAPSAPSLVVTSLADDGGGADLTLREALAAVAPGGTISFAPELAGGTIALTGPLGVSEAVTIDGDLDDDGAPDITLDAGGVSRVMTVFQGGSGTILDGLTFTGGDLRIGGGIAAFGDIELRNSVVSNNIAENSASNLVAVGGGLAVINANAVVDNTIFRGNEAEGFGGGISVDSGSLTLTNSLIEDNLATIGPNGTAGGGLRLFNSTAVVENVTFRRNEAFGDGGAAVAVEGGTLDATNVTFAFNEGRNASALLAEGADVSLTHATVAGNEGGSLSPRFAALTARDGANITLANSIVLGNEGTDTIGQIGTVGDGAFSFGGLNIIGEGADTDASDGAINADPVDVFDVTSPFRVDVIDGVVQPGATRLVSSDLTFFSMPVVGLEPTVGNPAFDAATGPDAVPVAVGGVEAVDQSFDGQSGFGARVRDLGAAEAVDVRKFISSVFTTDEDTPIEMDILGLLAAQGLDTTGFSLTGAQSTGVNSGSGGGVFAVNDAGLLVYDPRGSLDADDNRTAREFFNVFAEGPNGGISVVGSDVQVSDTPEPPATLSISADSATVVEGDDGVGVVTFTITRGGNLNRTVGLAVEVFGDADGARIVGTPSNELGFFNFAPLQETVTVTTLFDPDGIAEDNETLGLRITSPDSVERVVVQDTAATTILNDDARPVVRDDAFAIGSDEVLTGNLFADNGAGIDFDPDGTLLTSGFVEANETIVGEPVALDSGSTVTVNEDGSFMFDPSGRTDPVAPGSSVEEQFRYIARDEAGDFGLGTVTVTLTADAAAAPAALETGRLELTNAPQVVTFQQAYQAPVIVAFVVTERGTQPVNVRISDVSGGQATLRLQEPNYLDRIHTAEQVTYLVVEAGTSILPDGTLIEAGIVETNLLSPQGFEEVAFDGAFDETPVILSQVQTLNGSDFVTTRQREADADGFSITMQEEEANNGGGHATESLGWIAIEAGQGQVDDFNWIAGQAQGVSHVPQDVTLPAAFDGPVNPVATLSGFDGSNPAWARGAGTTADGFVVSAEEDASLDAEVQHIGETVDYFVFDDVAALSSAPLRPVLETLTVELTNNARTLTLSRDYDNPVIIGFVASENSVDPVNVRVRDVTGDQLTIALQEPNYLDGAHPAETVNLLIVEAGSWVLPDGTLLEAGTQATDLLSPEGFEQISFAVGFDEAPVILSQVQTFTGTDFVTTRQRNADADGFELTMQEEEANNGGAHAPETVGWVAVEAGGGSGDGFAWLAGKASGATDAATDVPISLNTVGDGGVVAGLSSFNGSNPAWARGDGVATDGFVVSSEEDQSADPETVHGPEDVDYFAFDGTGVLEAHAYDPLWFA